MAYTKFEQTYVDAYLNNMYPDVEEEQSQDTMLAAGPTAEPTGQVTVSGFKPQQVKTDVQPALGVARPIPQNKAQEALGYIGELLTKAGVQLDKVGIDIPALGRISLKDLTVGESGKVLEDMALGFYPIEGAGGFISGTTRIKPDPALELLNIAPIAGAAAKVAGKGVVKAGQAVAPKAAEMAEGYMRSIGGIADIVPPSPKPVSSNVSELGFYSAAKEAVDSIQQPKGTGEQFLKQIEKTPGVKPEEIKWTGLDDFLKSKKSVTKAEVQEFLDKNRVEVQEVTLDNKTATYSGELPKFSKYTLPGGENYREILITLPFKEPAMPKGYQVSKVEYDDGTSRYFAETPTTRSIAYKTEEAAQANLQKLTESLKGFRENLASFKSQHFDQLNILAHLRVNDRVDADGKKVLFVEEVQSDWHQAGRKKGYASATKPYEVFDPKDGKPIATFATEKEAKSYADELGPQIDYAKSEGVPDAPFKTTWHELSMKRAIQLAAEGGYDRVAFTTGKTQAERYDLSKQIDRIDLIPNTTGQGKPFTLRAYKEGGNEGSQILQSVDESELENFIGKELAKKIMEQKPNQYGDRMLSGVDLQVGGEGMKGFYDQILPKFLDKYAKKWDAKTGQMNMFVSPRDGSVPINYIDVTPKMKESVLTKGQPLFAIGAGGAAVQQEDNQ